MLLRTHPGATLPNATFCLIPGRSPDVLHFLQALQVQPRLGHPPSLSPYTPELEGQSGPRPMGRAGELPTPLLWDSDVPTAIFTAPSAEHPPQNPPIFSPLYPLPPMQKLLTWKREEG